MVSNLVNSEEKRNLMNLFKVLDVNGDGQLTKEELISGIKHMMIYSILFNINLILF